MFAARRIATSIAPRITLNTAVAAAVRPSVMRPAVRASTTSIARFLNTNAVEQKRATVQHPAPQWSASALVDGEFKELALSDYKGKFVVMVFYPADFTFVCPTELLAFSDRIEEFRQKGAEVVGISVDNVHSHLAWTNLPRKQGGLGSINIPLVSDIKKEISTNYNVLIPEEGLSLRGLFVIDPKGTLRISTIHDLPIGRSVDETLRVIDAIKFTDEHGEVCPANWQQGDATIKPDPKGSQDYFSKAN
ncbi:thioredoxin-dependent peroxide reductase, mitochondrial-like isoform 1 [Mucor ambiguus]|uniref:thioredoxin-dependent peroxiredoxin n=1 Tax=Mucor ambiguus TaxID=91626 RepID=A0A0C9LR47_9FUNG|nr:thioredoxin-dependent peroxide reductase, mitochondrial-like isoform 1 [Mucor ambiguus]